MKKTPPYPLGNKFEDFDSYNSDSEEDRIMRALIEGNGDLYGL